MTRAVEVPKKCASDASEKRSLLRRRSRRASQTVSTTGAATRRPVSRSTSPFEEGEVEASVVRRERSVSRESEEATDRQLRARRSPQVSSRIPVSAAIWPEAPCRVDERLERVLDRERAHARRPDLADAAAARGEPGRLEVEDDELCVLDQDVGVRRVGQPDARTEPSEPSVTRDDVLEQ